MPRVSLLLAVHDGAAFVGPAVESALRQTLRDLEVIVIDDASADGTSGVLDSFSDPRLVVLRNDGQHGLAESLNRGLDRATGSYVARLDADDVAFPDRLERQLARIESDPALAVVGSAVLDVDEHGNVGTLHRNPLGSRAVRWLSLFSSPFFHPTVLVDRELLDRHGLRYDPAYLESEDYDLWARLLHHAEGVNLGEPLVLKRVHPGQASLRHGELQRTFQRQVALREVAALAPELPVEQAERAWRFGATSEGDEGAYRALLAAFERKYGADAEVRTLAERALGRPSLRLAVRRARRVVEEPEARRRARSWLAQLSGTARVVIVSPEPTPYRAPLFDRLAVRPELDLTVIYAARTVAGRTWSVDLHHRAVFLSGVRVPGLRRVFRHDYPLTPGIRGALRAARPDVVVVSGWSTFASQAALAWARARGVPAVLLVESHDFGPRPAWRRKVKRSVVPRLVRAASAFLAVGSLARESLVAYGAARDRVRIFANTIDVQMWEERAERLAPRRDELRAQLNVGAEDVLVLSVGRLAVEKDFDTLVRAVAATGEPRLKLAIAGGGHEARVLERLAADSGVHLQLLGDLPEYRLAEAYVAADVFALFSLHETWGVVVNEAAASGLPLVLSERVGASHDLLRDGENGFRIPSGDVERAAGALQQLADDGQLRRRLGERSRELVRTWDYDASVEGFVAAVRDAAAR